MKRMLFAVAAVVAAAGPVAAQQTVQFKPIDTDKLVIKPSKAAASLTAQAIDTVGTVAGNSAKQNGYVKTINNLFGFKKTIPTPTQAGGLPAPGLFQSTQYKSYNTPVMPVSMPARR